MILHDFKCNYCSFIVKDELEKPTTCPVCTHTNTMEICFDLWTTFNSGTRDIIKDNLTDVRGFRMAYKASEDPVAMAELGLNPEGSGIRSFSDTQQKEYRERLVVDGDSPQLRKKILAVREENTKGIK